MPRLIDADRLTRPEIIKMYYYLPNGDVAIPIIDIEHAPTVDAVPVKHGRWINMKDGNGECSACGRKIKGIYDDDNADRFCRSCGAKMDLEEQHD